MRVKSELNIVFTDEQRIRTLLELDRVADAFDASHLLCLLLISASSVGAWMTAIVPWELKLTLTVTHQTVSFHFLSQTFSDNWSQLNQQGSAAYENGRVNISSTNNANIQSCRRTFREAFSLPLLDTTCI